MHWIPEGKKDKVQSLTSMKKLMYIFVPHAEERLTHRHYLGLETRITFFQIRFDIVMGQKVEREIEGKIHTISKRNLL